MKKLVIGLIALVVMLMATETIFNKQLPRDGATKVDTIGAGDTVSYIYEIATREMTGAVAWQYDVTNLKGNTKIKFIMWESCDTTYGDKWYNRVKLDSVATDSTLKDTLEINVTRYIKFSKIGFGAAGDTSDVRHTITCERK